MFQLKCHLKSTFTLLQSTVGSYLSTVSYVHIMEHTELLKCFVRIGLVYSFDFLCQ